MNRLATKALATASLLAFLVAGSACDLTEYNPSGLTDETVYTTPEGFETLVNAAYSYSRWWYGKEEGYPLSEMGTDIWMSGAGDEYPEYNTYDNFNATSFVVNGGGPDGVPGIWKQLYSAINVVNTGIARIGEAGFDDELRVQREAELRFLRAFYYWHIVETWGGVHFTTEPTTGIVTTANRTPVETFYEQIFEDLDFAVNNLDPTTGDYGRITRPGAEAFLARVYLTRDRNQEAIDMAERVINNYGFALLDNYADLWDIDNLMNSEVVWAINYARDIPLNDEQDDLLYPAGHPRGGFNGHLFFLATYDRQPEMDRDVFYGRPFNRYMPTRFLLDVYDHENGTRYEGSFREVWYANSPDSDELPGVELGDTALVMTRVEIPEAEEEAAPYTIFDRSDIYQPDGSPVQQNYYPSLTKFLDPARPSIAEQVSGRDVFVIRLAEMYMIAAEASLNLGNTGQAATYINVIRERAAREGREAEMMIGAGDVTRDFLLDEWAREFAGEQMRWFILKRNGRLVERVQQYNPLAAPFIMECHLVRPIPQSQIDAVENDAEFTQNPGCGY